ncbi:dipeptidase 1-like [Ptychodera flava]|uniref:dipeptidase 1-like n=1 Tax=Ptychodera flava TaxID=63121 RepID=UPI003969C577
MEEYTLSDTTGSATHLTEYSNKSKWRRNAVIGLSVAVFAMVLAVAIALPLTLNSNDSSPAEPTTTEPPADPLERARYIMKRVPLVDGHNDLPGQIRRRWLNQLSEVNLWDDLPTHTDIPRLREGLVGGQFWSVYIPCDTQYKDAVRQTIQQIDVTIRFVKQYSGVFELVTTAQGILDAHANGKIASLIGMEGGHHIDSSYGNLRAMYALGARYMTITHNCNTPWADYFGMEDEESFEFNGLSEWGEDLIREMNRIGMFVDLSHVASITMHAALNVTQAPVIFSHSGARALCDHKRNVPDDVLERLVDNGGVVMVVFFTTFVCPEERVDDCGIGDVADHIEYIVNICGYGCVGIGADYDGVELLPKGLEDVSTYPALIAELVTRGWSDENLEKLIGLNLVRAMEKLEEVRDSMAGVLEYEEFISRYDSEPETNNPCRTPTDEWPSYREDVIVFEDIVQEMKQDKYANCE